MISWVSLFVDPILRYSTVGSILMCLSSALMGGIVLLRKRALLGEALSHACFPGVVMGMWLTHAFMSELNEWGMIVTLLTAFASSFLGLKVIDVMEKKLQVKSDSALCFVLSSFFGVAILIGSYLQQVDSVAYRQTVVFLYGQAATMMPIHVVVYTVLALFILVFLLYFYRYLQLMVFDPVFASTLGISLKKLDFFLTILTVLTVVVGVRCVGVVLMAGMLIAPGIAARPLANCLSSYLAIACIFGIFSGLLGNYLSIAMPWASSYGSGQVYTFPTGPTILLAASFFAVMSLLFSPRSGLVIRGIRTRKFYAQCNLENALKSIWKDEGRVTFLPLRVIRKLKSKGWLDRQGLLTSKGRVTAENIVRLHRLWEVYLVDYLGQKAEKVHRTAEELEHLISSDLEKTLQALLKNPQRDPHHQVIPPGFVDASNE